MTAPAIVMFCGEGQPFTRPKTARANFVKQTLVMRNAHSDVDIDRATTNTDSRYLSSSQANGVSCHLTLFAVVRFTRNKLL